MAWFLTVKQQTVHDCVNYMIGIQRQENLQVDWVLEGLRGIPLTDNLTQMPRSRVF